METKTFTGFIVRALHSVCFCALGIFILSSSIHALDTNANPCFKVIYPNRSQVLDVDELKMGYDVRIVVENNKEQVTNKTLTSSACDDNGDLLAWVESKATRVYDANGK